MNAISDLHDEGIEEVELSKKKRHKETKKKQDETEVT